MLDVGRSLFDVRLGFGQYFGNRVMHYTLFPLTPALSLGEREHRPRSCKQSKTLNSKNAGAAIPSPQGRGIKGEGELAHEL